jgi:hypothetical protein
MTRYKEHLAPKQSKETSRTLFADPTIAFIFANEFRGTYGAQRR